MTGEKPAPDVSSILTDQVRASIGRSTGPIPLPEEIAASDLRRYIDATGDQNPLWSDDGFAREHGYRGRLIPPVMVVELSWRCNRTQTNEPGRLWHALPLPPEYADTRNAGLELEWLKPVYLGDHLVLQHRIVDIIARQGRAGLGVYITRESEYRNQDDEVVVRLRQTVVKFPKANGQERARSQTES